MAFIERVRQRLQERQQQLFGAISPNVTITARKPPVLTLTADLTTVYVGDTVTFIGSFKQANGQPIAGRTVSLFRDSTLMSTAVTDALGNYTMPWVVDVEGSIIIHSEAPNP